MGLPLVSVIIPTYRRSAMLEQAVDSVLNQTYNEIEVIVVDDNDPNTLARKDTQSIMGKYIGNEKVRYIQHPQNRNGSAARNTGIRHSRGKYIAFLDDDDEFLERKIELQVKELEQLDDSWGVCYTQFVRKQNGVLFDRGVERREGRLTTDILQDNFYIWAGSNLLVRRDLVDEIGGFDESFLRRQDLEFLVRLSLVTKIACVPVVCLVIHMDDRSNTLNSQEAHRANSQYYLSTFAPYIDNLPSEERKKVIVGQNLWAVKSNLVRRNFRQVYNVCRANGISLFVFIRYLFYLVRRRLLKLCYGFRV